MAGLAQTMVAFPFAATLFGVQQLANLLGNDRRRAKANLYQAAKSIESEFATEPLVFGAYQLGAEAQSTAFDLLWDIARLQFLRPEWLARTAGGFAQWSFDAARALTPGDNLNSFLRVLGNTFNVINLVNRAPLLLDLPSGPVRLLDAISRAYSFGDYSALWLVEGLGEEYAERSWSGAGTRGLLNSGEGAAVPDKSLLMLHAGMGIAFARIEAGPLTPVSPPSQIAAALRRFIDLVHANARPGYEGVAFESLGLVTRTWYAEMVRPIDEQLWSIDHDVLEYFWHGVGRSIYFSPLYLLPGLNAFEGVAREAPNELARLNGTAGAAWAFTLVNIRTPDIIQSLLQTSAKAVTRDDAFINGLMSTVIMSSDMLPDDPFVSALCGFSPQTGDHRILSLWESVVRRPCERALQLYYPILKKHGRLGDVFRYQDLDRLVRSLENA